MGVGTRTESSRRGPQVCRGIRARRSEFFDPHLAQRRSATEGAQPSDFQSYSRDTKITFNVDERRGHERKTRSTCDIACLAKIRRQKSDGGCTAARYDGPTPKYRGIATQGPRVRFPCRFSPYASPPLFLSSSVRCPSVSLPFVYIQGYRRRYNAAAH